MVKWEQKQNKKNNFMLLKHYLQNEIEWRTTERKSKSI